MKGYYGIIALASTLFFFSCNENEKKPVDPAPTVNKDTAQSNSPQDPVFTPYPGADVSPMDMSYFPPEFPKLKMANAAETGPVARVIYSRPHLQGRRLFPDILKYGEAWRLGANEATELQLFRDVSIQGKTIKQGRYILYCVPNQESWTIVINSNIDTWGLKADPSKDIARFDVPVKKTDYRLEYFSIIMEKSNSGADILLAWDDVEVRLPLQF